MRGPREVLAQEGQESFSEMMPHVAVAVEFASNNFTRD